VNNLVAVPIVAPLIGAALCVLVGRSRRAQRVVSLTVLTANVGIAVALLVAADRDGPLVSQAGGWPAPVGITLIVDRLSGIMLVVSALMLLGVLVYAVGQPGAAERNHVGFQSTYLMLAAGVCAAFTVGDLFSLFVSFEMMLTASYVLLTLGGRAAQVRAGMTYVVVSLVASTLFVTALAVVYASTGTVNMADLHDKIGDLPGGLRETIALLLVVVFGLKAGLFPLFNWLPDSYPMAPSAVTAVFAGLLTKVGVYALIRSQTLLFPADSRPATLLLILAGATMVIGILGAIAQDDAKRILSFNIVSHIGYMVMGLALFSVAGLAAAILYTAHHIVAMTTLFLTGGLIEQLGGSSQLSRLGNLVGRAPLVAALFLIPALTLAGIPPSSGFVPKLALVEAGFAGGQYTIVVVSLVVSLLTLLSMIKIWVGAFWAPATEPPDHPPLGGYRFGGPPLMLAPTVTLALISIAIAVAAGPLFALCERAAADLLDPTSYLQAVLG
jgi:multicomponent Na+:H+ antiporter subunit D